MIKYSLKIAFSIIIAGVFIMVAFVGYNYQNLDSRTYVILYLLAIFIFLFGIAAGQNIAMPVKKLLESVDSLNKGNLKSRVELNSKDELEQISKIFNKVADEFEKLKFELETVKKSADIKAKTRILILEEVVNALDKKIKNRTLEFQKVAEDSRQLKEQLKLKDMEAAELRNQITELGKKLDKKKGRNF